MTTPKTSEIEELRDWDELFRDTYDMGLGDARLDAYDFEVLRSGIDKKLIKLLEAERLRAKINILSGLVENGEAVVSAEGIRLRVEALKADLIKLEGK
jgi:hypothetical protein